MQHFADGQFHRAVVFDDHDPAGNRRFAFGESIQRIHHFVRVHGERAFDLNLDGLRSEIIDGLHLQFAFAGGVFNGGQQRIRRGGRRDFRDDHGGFIFDLDAGADFYGSFAVLIIARVHQAAGGEIRQAFKRLLLQNRNLRLE